MENTKEIVLPANCDQCSNACPSDTLACGRGKAHFERLKRGEKEFHSDDKLVNLLVTLGGVIRHKAEMIALHGGSERDMFASALTAEEQERLLSLLEKLDRQWEAEHAARHKKRH